MSPIPHEKRPLCCYGCKNLKYGEKHRSVLAQTLFSGNQLCACHTPIDLHLVFPMGSLPSLLTGVIHPSWVTSNQLTGTAKQIIGNLPAQKQGEEPQFLQES